MHKNLKKILVASASLLMLASVGAGTSQLTHPAHASRLYLDQYPSHWEKRDGITHWGVYAKRGFYRNSLIARYYARTFRKNGHTFLIKAVHDSPGEIIAMDGNRHVSNAKVRRALAPHHHAKHYRKHAHKHYHKRAKRHTRRYSYRRYRHRR